MKKEEKIKFLEQYEKLSNDVFGRLTFQTIKFVMIEYPHHFEKSEHYKSPEKIAEKFMLWQSREIPKDRIVSSKYDFYHDNDLTWNECVLGSKEHRKIQESRKEEVLSIEEQYADDLEDPMVQAFIKMREMRNNG